MAGSTILGDTAHATELVQANILVKVALRARPVLFDTAHAAKLASLRGFVAATAFPAGAWWSSTIT